MSKYYVYTLAYPDGRVFYVGKGTGNRIDQHEYEARSGQTKNPHKINVIRKIWAGGNEIVKRKVYETDDEYLAFEIEVEMIATIGRSNLTNLTDGGEGMSGVEWSEERKKQWSARMKYMHQESGLGSIHSLSMRAQNRNAKTWVGLIDPWGAEYPSIHNLHRFCEEWGLQYQGILGVLTGRLDNYKGWRKYGSKAWIETEEFDQEMLDLYKPERFPANVV